MKKLFVLSAVAVFVLVFASAGSVMAAEAGTSDKFATSIEQSLKHYVMALDAYNSGNYGEVKGQLQAAASNAKHTDTNLADLLEQLATPWKHHDIQGLSVGIASQIAIIYNSVMQDAYPEGIFDPDNPLGGVGGQAGMT